MPTTTLWVREGKTVRIGDVELTVVRVPSIQEGRVRLGFEAPRQIEIHRSEVFERIRAAREGEVAGGQ